MTVQRLRTSRLRGRARYLASVARLDSDQVTSMQLVRPLSPERTMAACWAICLV